MIAFFDTSVHVELLRGNLSAEDALSIVEGGPVRLSPIVGSELLRGSSGRARRAVEQLIRALVPIEPRAWKTVWLEAGRILPKVFRDHEEVGLPRLQNDVLLALTARHTGATLVARDRHFVAIRRDVAYRLVSLA